MKVVICTVGIGGWYSKGIARLINEFDRVSPGFEIQAWVNIYPAGAPGSVVENGYEYGPYCAKPFALAAARNSGADIAILVDAAFYPIRRIHPLIDHIAQQGYYLCKNGYKVGEWCSDRAAVRMARTRDELMGIDEVSSYCVGLNFTDVRSARLLDAWCGLAADRLTFPGPHTAPSGDGRNKGHVSTDSRVRGHRHDQTALSVIADRLGMDKLSERPQFTAYLGSETSETVLVNHGGI